MEKENITHKIIGAAYKVFNALGFGFLESVYKRAMVFELRKQNMVVKEEQPLKVYYVKSVVGEFFVDLFVENEIIVELKSVEKLSKAHEVQLVNYLNGMKKNIGLLINFGPNGIDVKRKYRKPEKSIMRQDQ